jgi:hypothetical protein
MAQSGFILIRGDGIHNTPPCMVGVPLQSVPDIMQCIGKQEIEWSEPPLGGDLQTPEFRTY